MCKCIRIYIRETLAAIDSSVQLQTNEQRSFKPWNVQHKVSLFLRKFYKILGNVISPISYRRKYVIRNSVRISITVYFKLKYLTVSGTSMGVVEVVFTVKSKRYWETMKFLSTTRREDFLDVEMFGRVDQLYPVLRMRRAWHLPPS